MGKVSILEFRKDAERILRRVQLGQRLILTYRGKPVARLEPILKKKVEEDDPFYRIDRLALSGGQALTNEEIDKIVYGI
jgi:prevent-host-death family protein